MAPRFVYVVDPVGESVTTISSYIPSISNISLSHFPLGFRYVANKTARLCEAFGPADGIDMLLDYVKDVPSPRRAALCLLSAAVMLLLLRCAFLCCASRSILRTHGQTQHINKDL